MDLGITGRTALVLGASGGLGSAIAVRLAGEGANVAVAGRSADALASTAGRVEQAGVKALPLQWDLGDPDRMEPNVAEVERILGPVEILVNNTGGPPPTPSPARRPRPGGTVSTPWCCPSSRSPTGFSPECGNVVGAAF